MNNLSTEEKIEYIYETLKTQEKKQKLSRIMKWFWRATIIGYFVYFYFFGWKMLLNEFGSMSNNAIFDGVKQSIQSKIGNELGAEK